MNYPFNKLLYEELFKLIIFFSIAFFQMNIQISLFLEIFSFKLYKILNFYINFGFYNF